MLLRDWITGYVALSDALFTMQMDNLVKFYQFIKGSASKPASNVEALKQKAELLRNRGAMRNLADPSLTATGDTPPALNEAEDFVKGIQGQSKNLFEIM